MVAEIFIAVRAVHFGACLLLFAHFAFDRLIATPVFGLSRNDILDAWRRRLRRFAIVLPWLILFSGIGWLILVAMSMSGLPLVDAIGPQTLGVVWHQTAFGAVWRVRLIFWLCATFASFFPIKATRTFAWLAFQLLMAALLLASLAWAGHGRETSPFHLVADITHLLVAGLWPTGLWPLFWFLRKLTPISPDSKSFVLALVRRFSALSLGAVALLVTTGWINSYYLLGSFENLFTQPYGRWLLAKIILVIAAVAIGAINLLRLKPRLSAALSDHESNQTTHALKRNVFVELLLGLVIIVIVAILGLLPPSI